MKHTARQVRFAQALSANIQYTYVTTIGNRVYARGRNHQGEPVYVEQDYTPIYYLPTQPANATHVGFDGTPLRPHMCDNIYEGKEFIEKNPQAFGDIGPEYMMLSDAYGAQDVAWEMDRLYVWDIDIEVESEGGFAKPEDPWQEVISITCEWWHMGVSGTVIYGRKDYNPKPDETYIKCATESELLMRFMEDMKGGGDYPDILTGWNIQFYDMPYVVNRAKKLFTSDTWTMLSPLDRLAERRVVLNGREQIVMDIKGLAILDYLELYRKLTLTQQESYRLDHIAHIELNERKLSYKEYGSLKKLYELDHQKFIEYNVQDVRIVRKLDDKLRLIELVCALAYNAKTNFVDCFKQVRLWDIMIYHKLRAEGKQIPPRKQSEKTDQYAGAYVKDPHVGMHEWVCSFDVASMYPHIIREWNLSPETILDQRVDKLTVDGLLDKQTDTSFLKNNQDITMAANGALMRKDVEGFLPAMLKTLYEERNRYKKLMNAAKKAMEAETDPVKKKDLSKQVASYNNQQAVRKVNLNSAYGALGSAYFRFYEIALAEAVTLSGQLIIRWVAKDINEYMNTLLKTTAVDYVCYSDTDSVYVKMAPIVELANHPEFTKEQTVEMLNKFCEKKIMPVIDKSFLTLAEYLNVYIPCLTMVRDVITDKSVWTAKKRYIMNVWDSEGTRYKAPKLKMMGIETVKSSTPAICRDMMTKAIKLFMNGTQQDVHEYLATCEAEFSKAPFEDIGFPRSVNGIKKYSKQEKSVPIHVKGTKAYNQGLKDTGLNKQYEPIREGEKIKFAYLREPNKFRSHVLSAPGGCPPEWEIEKYIDYSLQFEKSLIEPLKNILECAGWSTKHENTLFD